MFYYQKIPLLLGFLFFAVFELQGASSVGVQWKTMYDEGYSFEHVLEKNTMFQRKDTIFPARHDRYWFQVTVHNPFRQRVYLSANPSIRNAWFYQSEGGQWKRVETGLEIASDRRDHYFKPPYTNEEYSVYYVLMDVRSLKKADAFIPSFKIRDEKTTNEREWYIRLFSVLSIIILLVYIFNILVEYVLLRERTHVYYLAGLTGGLMYVLSYHSVLDTWINFRYVKVIESSLQHIYFVDQSYIINRLSILIICFGIIGLTTTFLNTKTNIPTVYKVMNWFLALFLISNTVSLLLTLFTSFPADIYFISISNILLVVAMLFIITSGILSLKKDKTNAVLFLTAHILPITFIIITSVYIESGTNTAIGQLLMPYLTILSVPFSLNMLLTLRVIYVRNKLNENKMLAQKIEMDKERVKHEKEVQILEKERIKNQWELEKLTRENLELKVDLQNRQLLSSAMQMQKKDEIIHHISKEVSRLSTAEEASPAGSLKAIRSLMRNLETAESNWATFKEYFEKIHPDFFETLRKEHPDLTPNETRLSAYLKLNLTNKEIAVLQNIEPTSVKRAKIRLKQKLEKKP